MVNQLHKHTLQLLASLGVTLAILVVVALSAATDSTWAAPGAQGTVPTPPPPQASPTRASPGPSGTAEPPGVEPTNTNIPIFLQVTETPTATFTPTPGVDTSAPGSAGQPAATAVGTSIPLGPYFVAIWDPTHQVLTIYATTPGAVIALGGTPIAAGGQAPAAVQPTPRPPTPTPSPTAVTLAALQGQIVFKSDRDGLPFNYYVMKPDGSDIRRLDKTGTETLIRPLQAREGLSPDGSHIVLSERRCGYQIELYTCALYILDTVLNAEEIYSGREPSQGIWFVQNNVKAKAPVWSPRGDYIVFISNHETPPGCRKTPNVFKGTPKQNPVIRRLTQFCAGADSDHPSFNPDGSQVVFWSEFPTGNREIFVLDVGADDTFDYRSTTPRLLTPDKFNDWDPLWIK